MTTYSFCPVCGGRHLTAGTPGIPPADVLVCGACGFHFWLNSKPAVGALITRKLRGTWHVLLTQRGVEPYRGMWDTPGGFLGNGESPEDGLARELREELGVEIFHLQFLISSVDQYSRDDIAEQVRFVLGLYYTCEISPDAVLVPADDVLDAQWFPLVLPPADLAFHATQKILDALRQRIEKAGV